MANKTNKRTTVPSIEAAKESDTAKVSSQKAMLTVTITNHKVLTGRTSGILFSIIGVDEFNEVEGALKDSVGSEVGMNNCRQVLITAGADTLKSIPDENGMIKHPCPEAARLMRDSVQARKVSSAILRNELPQEILDAIAAHMKSLESQLMKG